MPRSAVPLVFTVVLLALLAVFVIVESPRGPLRIPGLAEAALGEKLRVFLAAPGRGATGIHLFVGDDGETHIEAKLPLGRYSDLEAALEEEIRVYPARVVRKEQERLERSVRFLWDVRSAAEGSRAGAILLFVCPLEPAPPPAAAAPGPVAARKNPAEAAIIIDDVGYNLELVRELSALGRPLTLAVLPSAPRTRESAEAAHTAGLEVMLHLPLEALAPTAARALITIDTGMSRAEIQKDVRAFLEEVPWARGVNNHTGSKATEDQAVMGSVLEVVRWAGLYFIDSRTSRNSVAFEAAREMGVRAAFRNIFLDQPANEETVKARLEELFRLASKNGSAVAIGHAKEVTIEALRKYLGLADRFGVKLVFASEIVH